MPRGKRPTAVKIMLVILVIGSVLPLVAGTMILAGGMDLSLYFVEASLLWGFAAYYVLAGLVGLVLAWGLWRSYGWAWTITLIVSIIGIIIGVVTLPTGIASIVIDGIVAYLLVRRDTRMFYGK